MPDYYVTTRDNIFEPVYEMDALSARLVGSTAGTADWLKWESIGRPIPAHMVKLAASDAEAALIEGAAFYASRN